MKQLIAIVVAFVGFGLLVSSNDAGDKPKYTIKEVMKKAFDGKKYQKLEKEQLVDLFTALAQNTPPKGDAESWKAKTDALLAAAKDGDAKQLDKAATCGACHGAHKGKK